MIRLAVFTPNSFVAHEAVRRLEEASIVARVTTDRAYHGTPPADVVWIASETDIKRALAIVDALECEPTVTQCSECGYDLQGHDGPARCPECGAPARAAAGNAECRHCHELVPRNFARCWSCGAENPEPEPSP